MAGRVKKASKPVIRRSRGATSVPYDEWARMALTSDPELAQEYLRQTLEESETAGELLIGLRRIAEVQGMSRVAEATGLSRESSTARVVVDPASPPGATLPPACYPQRRVSRKRCPSGGQAVANHAA